MPCALFDQALCLPFLMIWYLVSTLHSAGGSVIPGAFLAENSRIGNMLIPAGAKLISVDGTATGNMGFAKARALAMAGGAGIVLAFD